MRLSIYNVIQGPVVTSKAQRLNQTLHRLVLKVHPESNKPMIKQAIELLFNVKVDNVRIIVRKGKKRTIGKRREVFGKLQKRAIIKLKPGYALNTFENVQPVESQVENKK